MLRGSRANTHFQNAGRFIRSTMPDTCSGSLKLFNTFQCKWAQQAPLLCLMQSTMKYWCIAIYLTVSFVVPFLPYHSLFNISWLDLWTIAIMASAVFEQCLLCKSDVSQRTSIVKKKVWFQSRQSSWNYRSRENNIKGNSTIIRSTIIK